MTIIAIIVAAGRGSRAAGSAGPPKQYRSLAGEIVLTRTLKPFLAHPRIDHIQCVINSDDTELYQRAIAGTPLSTQQTILPPVPGGASRQASVQAGLEAIADQNPDFVMIHDAARPFADAAVISSVLEALAHHDGALPGVPVADTLKRCDDKGKIIETVDRAKHWQAQTPQGFGYNKLRAAYRACGDLDQFTDDAAIAEADGLDVVMVKGSRANYKLTTPADFATAERELSVMSGTAPMEFRTGSGFDVHRFGDGDQVMLCGIAIAHDHGLIGHSDADVGLHALTDALLGAIGDGDIGSHFPPSDPQWKGAASDRFAIDACRRIRERGGRICHVDVTLICEQPKIGPHRDAMISRLCGILSIDAQRINIKATTTEGLGFTGRGEGIAAMATATIALPIAPE